MSRIIRLQRPLPAGPDAARVAYAPGRALHATAFAEQDRYLAARLAALGTNAGVLSGLEVSIDGGGPRFDAANPAAGAKRIVVLPGIGVGLDGRMLRLAGPLDAAWTDLAARAGALVDGLYLLLVRTTELETVRPPYPDAAARTEPDPLLDERRDSLAELALSTRLGDVPPAADAAAVALAFNTALGTLEPGRLAQAAGVGLPLAMLVVRGGRAVTVSGAAGRLVAAEAPLRTMLAAEMQEALLLAAPKRTDTAADIAALAARFRYLPAAGELPLALLRDPAETTAACPFFRPGIAVYLRAIRASQAAGMVAAAQSRPVIDLASDIADGVVLSLAIPDADWRPGLMDFPRPDPVLAADAHLAFARARQAQRAWRAAWLALYDGIRGAPGPVAQAFGLLLSPAAADGTPALSAPRDTLEGFVTAADRPADLASALVAAFPAAAAVDVPARLAALGYTQPDPEPGDPDPAAPADAVPVASDTVLLPLATEPAGSALPPASDFVSWVAAVSAPNAADPLLAPLRDAGVIEQGTAAEARAAAIAALNALPTASSAPPALLRLAMLQAFHAAFGALLRDRERHLTEHNRLIALQRLHFDMLSTSVSRLAGGVPPDGSGLQFVRLIPYLKLAQTAAAAAPQEALIAPAPALAATQGSRASFAMTGQSFLGAVRATTLSDRATTFAAFQTAAEPIVAARVSNFAPNFAASSVDGLQSSPVGAAALANTAFARPTLSDTGEIGLSGARAPRRGVASVALSPGLRLAPVRSSIGSLIGQDDVAPSVAAEAGTISQQLPFTFATALTASASHVIPGATLSLMAQRGHEALGTLKLAVTKRPPTLPDGQIPTPAGVTDTHFQETQAFASLLSYSRASLSDIRDAEDAAHTLEQDCTYLRDRMQSLDARITAAEADLAAARTALREAARRAASIGSDYVIVQRLVQEEADRVTTARAARAGILNAATGLFYVRVLHTVAARPLPPGRTLVADTASDLVPGCEADHPGPPAPIQPFLELLLETPLANWRPLRDLWWDLPDWTGIGRIAALRAARIGTWDYGRGFGAGAAAVDLAGIAAATRAVFEPVFRASFQPGNSLAETQRAALARFAHQDIFLLRGGRLRQEADALRGRFEAACGCLMETLSALAPSQRFAWAEAARAGSFAPLDIQAWPVAPGPARANEVAALGRVAALVRWMAGQLHDRSTDAAQTALANLVRACLLVAAHGDPGDAVTGTVTSAMPSFAVGEPVRVLLSRPPPIGTVLHVYDAQRALAGMVRIEDHDTLGTTARVVRRYGQGTLAGLTLGTAGASIARLE